MKLSESDLQRIESAVTQKESGVGTPLLTGKRKGTTWTQTDRAAHEDWGRLSMESPRAASLAHFLVAHMDANTNAVVASWKTLAELSGMSVATARRAMHDLETRNWVEGVQLAGGGAKAWVVNSRVAWARSRSDQRFAAFNARVLASESEQPKGALDGDKPALKRIPVISRGERQLPAGPSGEPPTQPSLDGLEMPLPEIHHDEHGQAWEINPITGEGQRVMTEDDMMDGTDQ